MGSYQVRTVQSGPLRLTRDRQGVSPGYGGDMYGESRRVPGVYGFGPRVGRKGRDLESDRTGQTPGQTERTKLEVTPVSSRITRGFWGGPHSERFGHGQWTRLSSSTTISLIPGSPLLWTPVRGPELPVSPPTRYPSSVGHVSGPHPSVPTSVVGVPSHPTSLAKTRNTLSN